MTRNQKKTVQSLLYFGQASMTCAEQADVLELALEVSSDAFLFDWGVIWLFDRSGSWLRVAASRGYDEANPVFDPVPLGETLVGRVAQKREPLLCQGRNPEEGFLPGKIGARCVLAAPMISRGQVVGVMQLATEETQGLTKEDTPLLLALSGQVAGAIENVRLLSDLKRVSGDNRALAQLNDRILQSVNLGIYTLDEHLTVTSWNAAMERSSGIEHEGAVGRKLFELFPRLEAEGFAHRVRRVMAEGVAERFRLNHRNLKGEVRTQKRRIAPLVEKDRIVGVVVIIEDVTEFRRLMDQTIQSEKLAEVGRLSAGIAHEINNPLAVISYGAQLILREEGISADIRDVGQRITSEVDRLKHLTGGLLSFSRAKGAVKRWVDLNAVIEDVVRLVRYQFQRQSMTLTTELGELPQVWADDSRLKQVLINLMLNAAHAMEEKGHLTVSSEALEDGFVRLKVADDGPGIPQDVLPKIFEPFFTTKNEGEGTGLGLYICRNIVQEHDGELAVASSENGTCFAVTLPLAEAE